MASKKPNIPMNNPITTCRQKVDRKKWDKNWDRIFGNWHKDDSIMEHTKKREKK